MNVENIRNETRINVTISDDIYLPFRVYCLKNHIKVKDVITAAIKNFIDGENNKFKISIEEIKKS